MLARTPALAGLRWRPLLQTSPVGPQPRPSPLRSRLRLTAASRPGERSLSSRPSLGPSSRADPARRPASPPHPAQTSPPASRQSTHGDPGPRAAAAEGTSGPGRPAGAERQRPRGGDRGGRARSRTHASACRPGHAGPLCACSGGKTLRSRAWLPTNRRAS